MLPLSAPFWATRLVSGSDAREATAKGQILRVRHSWGKLKRYYILDLSGNVMDEDIDPKKLARKLGVRLSVI